MKKLMIVLGMAAMVTAEAFADLSIGYQGKLCNAQGETIVSQTKQIEFRLYNSDESGATALWGRKYAVRIGANGVFNVELCDETGSTLADMTATVKLRDVIKSCAKDSNPLYVGLTVENSSGEIAPRQKLLAAPYSAYALDVGETSGDFTVNGDIYLTGSIAMNNTTDTTLQAGNVTANTLTSKGEATVNGKLVATKAVEAQDGLKVSGLFQANDEATFNKAVTANDAVTFNKAVTAKDVVTFNKAVTANDEATFEKNVTAKTNLTVKGELDAAAVKQGGNMLIPRGVIVMWSGSVDKVPDGWTLCDGSDNTPNLKGRFIVGASTDDEQNKNGTYGVGVTGGYEEVKLTIDQMPSHTHDISVPWRVVSHYSTEDRAVAQGLDNDNPPENAKKWKNCALTKGGDKAHENRPPYYALAYIMKL